MSIAGLRSVLTGLPLLWACSQSSAHNTRATHHTATGSYQGNTPIKRRACCIRETQVIKEQNTTEKQAVVTILKLEPLFFSVHCVHSTQALVLGRRSHPNLKEGLYATTELILNGGVLIWFLYTTVWWRQYVYGLSVRLPLRPSIHPFEIQLAIV